MVWSMDLDDFRGSCGAGKYPLIKSMTKELAGYRVGLEYDGPYEGTANGGSARANKDGMSDVHAPLIYHRPLNNVTLSFPIPELVCSEEDGHISYHIDKADCTKYYMCEGERKHHMPCPAQLVFNDNENVCDWPERVERCQHLSQTPATN